MQKTQVYQEYIEKWKTIVREAAPETRFEEIKDLRHYFVIDLPRQAGLLHGSSIALFCKDNKCFIEMNLVVHPKLEDLLKEELEKMRCKLVVVHVHGLLVEESHMHFECELDIDEVEELLKYVRYL